MTLLVQNVSKQFFKNMKVLKDLSFQLEKGECVGIVGESGSGKSTLARVLLGLEPYQQGLITFNGNVIPPKKPTQLRQFRKKVQMIFQDSSNTLNPKLPIWKSVTEPLDNYKEVTPSFIQLKGLSKKNVAEKLLQSVGLEKQLAYRNPGSLSGGQKQRVNIARAISIEPELLICDEPTASLDVMLQVQILHLLKDLQKRSNMAILFISHDLRAVTFICQRVIVLKKGVMVDQFNIKDLYQKERHPYTKALIQAAQTE
ncbi:ABC transporter ATP-binding protein [Halalkalibacter krulwichiae]|uniref:Oligopeptide transport ATP-binding protein OppF n=1 Tax=Halalkalibacter krulwichiae TaxID=199441 RepID=A0A1X9MH91_9BACI|nr:dipeptide/oligopeptide/nickel ABC transporter ATP-binding protein [Halalkalibacter krulwichiae]ARK30871.1 Oligopeptide transport ATP-binding protein OppF [Halalkalibacter krulwichiae]